MDTRRKRVIVKRFMDGDRFADIQEMWRPGLIEPDSIQEQIENILREYMRGEFSLEVHKRKARVL